LKSSYTSRTSNISRTLLFELLNLEKKCGLYSIIYGICHGYSVTIYTGFLLRYFVNKWKRTLSSVHSGYSKISISDIFLCFKYIVKYTFFATGKNRTKQNKTQVIEVSSTKPYFRNLENYSTEHQPSQHTILKFQLNRFICFYWSESTQSFVRLFTRPPPRSR